MIQLYEPPCNWRHCSWRPPTSDFRPLPSCHSTITAAEHAAIVAREGNAERGDFYELLWHTVASQDKSTTWLRVGQTSPGLPHWCRSRHEERCHDRRR